MKKQAKILSLLAFLLTPCISMAVPAHSGTRTVSNPDGTTITLRLLGDEYGHVTVDENGNPVELDSDGYWRRSTTTIAQAQARRSRAKARQVNRTSFPRTGKVRSLIVLVDFPDVEFATPDIRREVDEMLNLPGFDRREHIGCAADYFRTQSLGQFDPSFDVYGPVRASHPATYYGENDSNGDDKRAYELAIELCAKLDGEIDFSCYDLDDDGLIDNLYFFYAGYGENFAGNKASWIWPHAAHIDDYGIPASARTFDGKVLNSYGCCAELYGSTGTDVSSIGTFCHEFGHILGLPDTYDVNYSDDGTGNHPDKWDIMASGSYLPATRNCGAVPAGYTAVERWILGWAEPSEISAAQSVSLAPLQSTAQSARISTADPDEFFILENRQQSGYDRYIPYHGMLIWHVDRRKDAYINVTIAGENKTISCADAWDLEYNAVNSNATHQCLEIEKASGNDGSKSSQDTPFPGRQMRTSFTDDTNPAMKSWSGKATGKPVSNITERDGMINFDFMGGGPAVCVEALEATAISSDGFTAQWAIAPLATEGYIVTLYAVSRSIDADAKTIDSSFAGLPEGWSIEGEASYSGNTVTLGASKASKLTTSQLDLGKGATLTIRASQSGSSAATLKIYAGDELIDQYIPTEVASDYIVDIPAGKANTLSFAVNRRKSVVIEHITLQQEVENIAFTQLQREIEPGTSHRFDGLATDSEYAYRVAARGYASGDSQAVYVRLGDVSGIEEINNTDSAVEYYNLQGMKVSNPIEGNIYIVKKGNKTYKLRQ